MKPGAVQRTPRGPQVASVAAPRKNNPAHVAGFETEQGSKPAKKYKSTHTNTARTKFGAHKGSKRVVEVTGFEPVTPTLRT